MRVVLLLLVCVIAYTSARTITWTGAAGNSLWGFANNWDANAVPTSGDDVIINPLGGGSITISAAAAAHSITIGGGNYRQNLILQASLSVVDLTIGQSGTLTIATNNDMPLSASGTVRARLGGLIDFRSGAVIGLYIIEKGAALLFSTNALKLLNNANITIHGEATVQASSIQLTKGSVLNSLGNFTGIGQINIFANDKPNLLYSGGNFTYQGAAVDAPLSIQVNSTFNSDINIVSGAVIIKASATVAGIVKLPQGATITTESGTDYTWFRSIQGAVWK
jgi:hypothetical protein